MKDPTKVGGLSIPSQVNRAVFPYHVASKAQRMPFAFCWLCLSGLAREDCRSASALYSACTSAKQPLAHTLLCGAKRRAAPVRHRHIPLVHILDCFFRPRRFIKSDAALQSWFTVNHERLLAIEFNLRTPFTNLCNWSSCVVLPIFISNSRKRVLSLRRNGATGRTISRDVSSCKSQFITAFRSMDSR